MAQRFADDAVIRRIDAEGVILLGGGRALLLQLAHPAVAAGVAEHSDFEGEPLKRLFGTLEATYTIVFGAPDEVEAMARRVRAMHGRVTGEGYRADDPALLCWVNATLVDTAVVFYERWVRPLTPDERDEYVRDSRHVAHVLGCPLEAQPADWASFRTYVDDLVDTLEVSDTARTVASSILHPTALPRVTAPALALSRAITIETVPPPLRHQYGLASTPRHDRLLDRAERLAGPGYRLLPRSVRQAPQAAFLRRGRRRVARREAAAARTG